MSEYVDYWTYYRKDIVHFWEMYLGCETGQDENYKFSTVNFLITHLIHSKSYKCDCYKKDVSMLETLINKLEDPNWRYTCWSCIGEGIMVEGFRNGLVAGRKLKEFIRLIRERRGCMFKYCKCNELREKHNINRCGYCHYKILKSIDFPDYSPVRFCFLLIERAENNKIS